MAGIITKTGSAYESLFNIMKAGEPVGLHLEFSNGLVFNTRAYPCRMSLISGSSAAGDVLYEMSFRTKDLIVVTRINKAVAAVTICGQDDGKIFLSPSSVDVSCEFSTEPQEVLDYRNTITFSILLAA